MAFMPLVEDLHLEVSKGKYSSLGLSSGRMDQWSSIYFCVMIL